MNSVLFYTFAPGVMEDHRVEKWLAREADVGERCFSRLASFLVSNEKQTNRTARRAKMATLIVLVGMERKKDQVWVKTDQIAARIFIESSFKKTHLFLRAG